MSDCTNEQMRALLHTYELGGLSEEDAERFEIHLTECETCFNDVKAFQAEARILRVDNDARAIIANPPLAAAAGESWIARIWSCLWPKAPLVFRPAVAYFAVLLIAFVAIPFLSDSTEIRPFRIVDLVDVRSGGAIVIESGAECDYILRFRLSGADTSTSYGVVIKSANNKTVFEQDNFSEFDNFGIGGLILPGSKLSPGQYELHVTDPTSEPAATVRLYRFKVE